MNHPSAPLYEVAKTIAVGCLVTIATGLFATAAYAQQQAYTNKAVNLRAGPAREYPVVEILPIGAGVTVMAV